METNTELIPRFWKNEWGKKPANCRSNHYALWRDTYYEYLCPIYDSLKSSKVNTVRYITFEKFVWFVYTKSSGYISQYA